MILFVSVSVYIHGVDIKMCSLRKKFLALSLSNGVFIMLINVEMPTITIVGILTFMSRINFLLR